jgi:hypothetical protein
MAALFDTATRISGRDKSRPYNIYNQRKSAHEVRVPKLCGLFRIPTSAFRI